MSELLTLPETARRLGVGETWLWQQTAKGILKTVRLPGGRLVRVRESDLEAFIDQHVEGAPVDAAGTAAVPAALEGRRATANRSAQG
ncbi:MAG TPA: helix-turn-helix domain-containing protein [Candidatus Nitrosotalea sp.]|nr:helix-turn-helix domain-containing protein [Candidatus Nitrosotalea sp.]